MNENSTPVPPGYYTNTPIPPHFIAEWERAQGRGQSPPARDSGLETRGPRSRGGQAGNQNARTHGFYAQHMTAKERRVYEAASGLGGTVQETILLRSKLAEMLEADEPDVALIAKVISLINRLEKDRKVTSANSGKQPSGIFRQIATFGARCPNYGHCDRFDEGVRLYRQGVDLEELTGGPSPDPLDLSKLPEKDST